MKYAIATVLLLASFSASARYLWEDVPPHPNEKPVVIIGDNK